MDITPKTIIRHPCPICKVPMEVELVEIRKQLIEGQIDLEAVTKEWRHICTKCDHDTTKYIKVCHYCNTPDDISKLSYNATAPIKEKAYFHPGCETKANLPYPVFGFIVFLIITGIIIGIYFMKKNISDNEVPSLIKKVESLSFNLATYDRNDEEYKKKYEEKKATCIAMCREALKKDPYYIKTYAVLANIYSIDGNDQETANNCKQGLNLTKKKKDVTLEKEFKTQLDKLRKKGIFPKF
jgi:hypothetical protein